jgi:predicted nucleotidyltransferase
MDVSHPISSVIPTLDAPVLEVLAGTTRGLSGREVHRLARAGSVRGVQLVLARLVSHGLVRADEHSSATLYTANRDHLAWPAIEALVGLRAQLLERLREAVGAWLIAPLHVSLFGSAARGDGSSESDLDLLIVRPDAVTETDEVWEAQVDSVRDLVPSWTGNRCQVFDIDRARLGGHVAARDPLVNSWLRDGVLLVGEPLRSLIDSLALEVQA